MDGSRFWAFAIGVSVTQFVGVVHITRRYLSKNQDIKRPVSIVLGTLIPVDSSNMEAYGPEILTP